MSALENARYDSYSEARAHFKALLDAAAEGRPAIVRRGAVSSAVVDAALLRATLESALTRPAAVAEAGGWSLFIPGVPVAADGETFDEAVDELIDALREFAEDWEARLRLALNHPQHWPLVQFIALSDDVDLCRWIVGET